MMDCPTKDPITTALKAARACIQQDRQALADSHTSVDGLDEDGAAGVAEYDEVLRQIEEALQDKPPTPCRCGPDGCADSSCPGRASVSVAERMLDVVQALLDDPLDYCSYTIAECRVLQAELRRLAAENEQLASYTGALNERCVSDAAEIGELRADRDSLAAEVEALRADAERYRWLREHGDAGCTEKDGYGGQTLRMGEWLDAAIDAAKASGA